MTFIYQKMQNIHFYSITLTDDIEFQAFKLNRGFAYIFVDCRSVTTIVRIVLKVENIARLPCKLCELVLFLDISQSVQYDDSLGVMIHRRIVAYRARDIECASQVG